MEFKQTRSQIEIVAAARDFAKSEFDKERIFELDREGRFPHDTHQKAAELGFTSIHFDEACLGGGLGFLENVLMAEELCRRDSTLGSALMLSAYGSDILNRFGSQEQKSRFLTSVSDGRFLSSASSLPYGVNGKEKPPLPTAVQEGESWVINGEVQSSINGGLSGFYLVLCHTDAAASAVMILVEGDRPGIGVVDTGPTVGLRMTKIPNLTLEDVRVPLSNTVGNGDGLKQMASFWEDSSILLASLALGTGQGVLERAAAYVKQRVQFGKRIAEFQVTRHKLSRMALMMEQARTLTYRASWERDQKKRDPALPAMAKLSATSAALECAHEAIQLLGGYGYSSEYEVERFCRDAKTLHLLGGEPGFLQDHISDTVIGRIK